MGPAESENHMDGAPLADNQEARQKLLAAVDGIADILTAQAATDEESGTLSATTVTALQDAGMFRLKLPASLGGAEADPATQIHVLEALSYANPAAGWCAMVGSTAVGLPGAFLPDATIAEIFPAGRIPRGAIVAMPIGKTEPVDGGYRLTGRWPFASGVRHSEWIAAGAMVTRDGTPERRMMIFPTASATLHDNWQVAGLKGTGSCDFFLTDDLFVLEAFTWDPACRGAAARRAAVLDRPSRIRRQRTCGLRPWSRQPRARFLYRTGSRQKARLYRQAVQPGGAAGRAAHARRRHHAAARRSRACNRIERCSLARGTGRRAPVPTVAGRIAGGPPPIAPTSHWIL